jgi:uncharacterized membrane protein
MDALAIRNELLHGATPDLHEKRKIILLSAIGLADFAIISLYQTGIIKHLPDIDHPLFDSDKVNASKDAYMFAAPDGPISALAYAATMVLASVGGSNRTGRKPLLDLALGATIAGNAAGALYYLYNMIFKQKKICLYCLTGAGINIASAIIITPTIARTLKNIFTSNNKRK